MVLSNRFSQIRTRSSRVNAQTPSISGSGPAITMA
jgi:homoserine kinase